MSRRSCVPTNQSSSSSLYHPNHLLIKAKDTHYNLSPLSLLLVFDSLIPGAIAFGQFGILVSTMAKIFKYFSQIFVVKEREMEIGFPSDVKHVAHIGWDGPSDSTPSWMNEFKNEPDFSTFSRNNNSNRRDSSSSMAASTWASQGFESSMGRQPSTRSIDLQPNDSANAPKKSKRKKVKSSSSSSSSSRSSRHSKTSKATYTHMEPTPNLLV